MSSPAPAVPCSTEFAQQAREQYHLLKIGVLALLVLACAIPFSINLVDPDLWGHVKYAQDWMAAGEMPRTATHTYTAEGYPWVNHEILAEFSLALGVEHLGIHLMLVVKCLWGLAIATTMWWTARRHGVPALSTWALLVLVSANFQAFFAMRPQLLSFALCTLTLVCLDRAFFAWPEERRVRVAWLTPLPPLFAVWVNSHGGFVAGLCIVGAYLLGRMIELAVGGWREARGASYASKTAAMLRIAGEASNDMAFHAPTTKSVTPATARAPGSTPWRTLILLAIIGLLCVAATLVNPYGWGMHLWLWNSWGGAPPEITEWAPPLPGKPVFWPLVALIGVTVGSLAATQRRRDWTQIVILALVAWQACSHLRHIAFLTMLVGFWLPVHWHSAIRRLRPDPERKLPIMLPSFKVRAALATLILSCVALQSYALSRRLSDFSVVRSQYPVDALQFMVDHRLGGKAVVAFNWAQYAIAAMAPDLQVQFDGRFDTCYPQEVIDMHFDWLLGDAVPRDRDDAAGPIDGTRVLEAGQPDLVLVEKRYPTTRAVMEAEAARDVPRWTLLYSDPIAQLWGRRSKYDDPASPAYFPPAERRLDVKLLEARWQWPALPDRSLWNEAERAERAADSAEPRDDGDRLTELTLINDRS